MIAASKSLGKTQLRYLGTPQSFLGILLNRKEKTMVNKTTELHQICVAIEQPTKQSTYAEKLKYLVKVIDPNFPSYDFILRLASFATCSKLSSEQQKKADEFITYFENQGFFNPILYLDDKNTHQMLFDFCKEKNLKRIKIQQFILEMSDGNWGFNPFGANGLKNWKDEIINKNKQIIKAGVESIKRLKHDEEIRKTIIESMLTGDIMAKRGIK